MSTKDASEGKVWFSRRGEVHMPLGGEDRILRFRTHEISQLEGKMKQGILTLLNEDNLGLSFLKNAIVVGVAHQFVGKKGSAKQRLTEALVEKWMDDCDGEEGRLSFEELTEAVIKAVVGGMPGGQKYLDAMDSDDDGAGESAAQRPPERSSAPPPASDAELKARIMAPAKTESSGAS